METIIISGNNKSDIKILMELAKKLGLKTKTLTKQQIEDFGLAQKIDEGMKSETVSREEVMKALGK